MSATRPILKLLLTAFLSFGLSSCATGPSANSAENGSCSYCSDPARKFVGVWEAIWPTQEEWEKNKPVLTSLAQKSIDRQMELRDAGKISYDYSAICIPPASPTSTMFGAQEIKVDDDKMTWTIEATSGIRWIWTDGRNHPPLEELRPAANGHAIGRWDGDTFVIDSVGFLHKAMAYVLQPGNVSLYPSPEMRFVERLRLAENGQAIISERTLYDPVNLKEPWRTTQRYERRDWELGETICMENNKIFFYFDSREDIPGYSDTSQ